MLWETNERKGARIVRHRGGLRPWPLCDPPSFISRSSSSSSSVEKCTLLNARTTCGGSASYNVNKELTNSKHLIIKSPSITGSDRGERRNGQTNRIKKKKRKINNNNLTKSNRVVILINDYPRVVVQAQTTPRGGCTRVVLL